MQKGYITVLLYRFAVRQQSGTCGIETARCPAQQAVGRFVVSKMEAMSLTETLLEAIVCLSVVGGAICRSEVRPGARPQQHEPRQTCS